MENKINIAELLKDCPEGMELDCTIFEGLEFDGIADNEYLPIRCRIKNPEGGYTVYNFTKYGCWSDMPFAKCVIFPKGKTSWEGFRRPFKDGDIIYTHANCLKVGVGNTWISIYQENRNGGVATYIDYAEDGSDYYSNIDGDKAFLCMEKDILRQRLATEEEKAKLFQAIKEHGYKWNAKTKTLEKLPKFKVGDRVKHKSACTSGIVVKVSDKGYHIDYIKGEGVCYVNFTLEKDYELVYNKFDITTLKAFDKVLVRDHNAQEWVASLFSNYNEPKKYKYICVNGSGYAQCIPYEENKHLLGTTNDCDEYYKTWE